MILDMTCRAMHLRCLSLANLVGCAGTPFVVMTSESDCSLRFSALLTAQPERPCSARDRDRLPALDRLVLDLSRLPNARKHSLAATSPVVVDIVTSARADVLADRFPRRGVIDVAAFQAARAREAHCIRFDMEEGQPCL